MTNKQVKHILRHVCAESVVKTTVERKVVRIESKSLSAHHTGR